MLGTITDEIIEAWEWASVANVGTWSRVAILRDFARDAHAAKLKLKFQFDHESCGIINRRWLCISNRDRIADDECGTITKQPDSDWQAAAEAEFARTE